MAANTQQLEAAPLAVKLPEEERKVLEHWERVRAFETSVEQSAAEGRPEFTFYDGPPFATGLPHYGHILAGTIKDVVTRYAHQTGHHVVRRFGWDTHGLPVEFEIDKKLGVTGPDMVMNEIGIKKYNQECRDIVMRYSKEWEQTVKRMGRWIDFENDYKTLDPSFMESVWWVFSQVHRKGLVYEGHKVMPFSIGCSTPISNFEASDNYKTVQDPTCVAAFQLRDDPETSFVAWTTTPWTLPSNLALCVHPTLKYVKVRDLKAGRNFILAEDRLCQLFESAPKPEGGDAHGDKTAAFGSKKKDKKGKKKKKNKKKGNDDAEAAAKAAAEAEAKAAAEAKAEPAEKEYEVLETYEGKQLDGVRYVPLFPYFEERFGETGFRVVVDEYVTATDGTGIVHNAPGHGEDDHRVCDREGVITKETGIACPVGPTGRYTDEVTDYAGVYVKDADRQIIRRLRAEGKLVQESTLSHSYPHCWRSDTPLIYMAVPSWYIDVPAIKERLLANNEKTYWVPESVKTKRFRNWLADARPWSVSRNRFWGTPIPIWRSEDHEQMVVISSVDELKRLSGEESITDLHRDSIDHITIPDPRGDGFPPMRRVPEVFDCWFESGSMPYAQQHYPFENREAFEGKFPADFIAEGLDQTRGWFYTLMVLSTALFDRPAFKNLIVNGLVLADDGEKMSKRKRNYDPPLEVVEVHGADAVRLYLINSPVVRAEPLKFKTEGVRDVVKSLLLPWYHTYRLLCEQSRRHASETGVAFSPSASPVGAGAANVMDRWVVAALQDVIAFTRQEMAAYRLYTVVPALVAFIEQLSNWYVRFNKSRLKGLAGPDECQAALGTLFHVLHTLCRLMAPFTPFLVETMYQNLRRALPEAERRDSVHYLEVPEVDESALSAETVRAVGTLKAVVELGRAAREATKSASWKTPLQRVKVLVRAADSHMLDALRPLASYVREELNVREVEFSTDLSDCVLKAQPNRRSLGKRLGNKMGAAARAIRELTNDELVRLAEDGRFTLAGGVEVTPADVELSWDWEGDRTKWTDAANVEQGVMVVLCTEVDESCRNEGHARELMSRVQAMRKKAGLLVEDRVAAYHSGDGPVLKTVSSGEWLAYVERKFPLRPRSALPDGADVVTEVTFDYAGESITLLVAREK